MRVSAVQRARECVCAMCAVIVSKTEAIKCTTRARVWSHYSQGVEWNCGVCCVCLELMNAAIKEHAMEINRRDGSAPNG